MKLFLDSADIAEIRDAAAMGLLDGVTTNPSLLAKVGRPVVPTLQAICAAVPGPVSAEVFATDRESMLAEAEQLAAIAPNIVVKLPVTEAGLAVVAQLSRRGVATNATLCFSVVQAVLAAKAGATFISPFVGRIDDIAGDGMELIAAIVAAYARYGWATQVLVASIRSPRHVARAIELGAHAVTVPHAVIGQLLHHPLTDAGLAKFVADAARVPRETSG
jgi:transaldolase